MIEIVNIDNLSKNKFSIGLVLLMSTIGQNYIVKDIPRHMHYKCKRHPFIRKVFVFCMLFIGIGDFETTIGIFVIYLFLINMYKMSWKRFKKKQLH